MANPAAGAEAVVGQDVLAPEAPRTEVPPAWRRVLSRVARALEEFPLERIALAAIAGGVVLRLFTPFTMDLRSDGDTYAAMGHAWMLHHKFLLPWGDVTTWAPSGPALSHHYPPAYPFYLGMFYSVFGFGLAQTKAAAVLASLVALVVVYWTSKDLWGRERGLLATAVLAVEPHLVWSTGTGFSENLVVAFFAVTMWAILKSLADERVIVVAGLAAGLAYLTRASVGYFFVIAGVGGFLWRFYYMRWRVFRNVYYLAAIAIFGAIVGLWAWRNVAAFGWPHWETSSYTTWIQSCIARDVLGECSFADKGDAWPRFLHGLAWKAPLFLAFVAIYVVPFAPESWRSLRRIRDEGESALWLSVFLVVVISWIMTSLFWAYENADIWWLDNHRYFVIAALPLAWILLRHARLPGWQFRSRAIVLLVALFAVSCFVFFSPVRYADLRAAEDLTARLEGGEAIAVDGNTMKYAFYPYLTRWDVEVYGWSEGMTPDYILSLKWSPTYEGYRLVKTYEQEFWNGGVMTASLFEREA